MKRNGGGPWAVAMNGRLLHIGPLAALMRRAAEQQAFDNLALVAASCVLDCVYGLAVRGWSGGTLIGGGALAYGGMSTGTRSMDMHTTSVKELMEDKLIMVDPDMSLSAAAKKMKETNCGCLLVGHGNKPDGIITDRDIVVRAISRDLDPAEEKVRDHMTGFILSCGVNDTLARAGEVMREHAVSRLVAVDDDGHARGLLSFGRILRNNDDGEELAEVIACATGRKSVFTARKTLSDAAKTH